ncbi:MAG: hypothetical protein NVS1B7_1010 [Candidatus Saccharimonadales bacterium]
MSNTTMQSYDVIIIGAGSGGLAAAEISTQLGASTALIEANARLGGECLHAGCVPSKALIHAAREFDAARKLSDVSSEVAQAAFSAAMTRVQASIDHIEQQHDNDEHYQNLGIVVYHGRAVFTSKNTITIDGSKTLKAKRFIIATGSQPFIPPITGLESVPYLTNETIFKLESLPDSLIVIGGGPIGCELGQALAMFGCKVTIVTHDDRILPRDEPEASAALLKSFSDNPDIKVIFGAKTTKVAYENETVQLTYERADARESINASAILIATGRMAQTKLGLEAAGVKVDRNIVTDKFYRTSNASVYAIGDVIGGPNFTHEAVEQAIAVTQNAVLGLKKAKHDITDLVWSTFTYPEIAHVGYDEAQLQKAQINFQKYTIPYADIDKAVTDEQSGCIKVLVSPAGRILGVTVIGGPASEIIASFAIAKKLGLPYSDLGKVMQAYPTYAYGIKIASSSVGLAKLSTGSRRLIVTILRRIHLGR